MKSSLLIKAILLFFVFANSNPLVFAQTSEFRLWGVTASGASGLGSVFNLSTDGSGFNKAKTFESNVNGERPIGSLLQATDGYLYGVTEVGGLNGLGTISKFKPDGSDFVVLHHFNGTDGKNPYDQLIQATNGDLYGMTISGGISDRGVIYKLKTDGSGFTILHKFDGQGSQPQGSLLQAVDGDLYGMTTQGGTSDSGVIFKIKTDGTGFTVLLNFADHSGRTPFGNLIQGTDAKLYGLTAGGGSSGNGIIFKVDTNGSSFIKLFDFSQSSGTGPTGSLIRNNIGQLFGTTSSGGTYSNGVIFRLNADGTNYTKLYEFDGPTGSYPENLSLTNDGRLLGTTWYGGLYSQGVIFTIDGDGNNFTKLYDLDGNNGSTPITNGLTQATNGDFYGLSSYGGISNNGVIFKIDGLGTYSKIKEFYSDGGLAQSSLIKASNSNLYGMTTVGGLYGFGIIYKISKDGVTYQKLFDFDKLTTGGSPQGSLFEASDGDLYGLTSTGGVNNAGTLFKIKLDGSGFTKLHDFDFANGGEPLGSLIEVTPGELIGTTSNGGISNGGSIFKISLSGTGFTTLFKFNPGTDGGSPNDLILTDAGDLIGTCSWGTSTDYGSIFKIKPDGSGFLKLMNFDGISNGANSRGGLTKISTTEFAGTTSSGGANNRGTIFKINSDGSGFSRLFSFSISTGLSPLAGRLTLLPDGYLYGMTWVGGANSGGTIFKIKTNGTGFSKLYDFSEVSGNFPLTSGLLAIEKETQTIVFDPLSPRIYGDANFPLSATASSGLPITFESSNQTVATINNNIVTIIGAGTATITAKQVGNIAYFSTSAEQNLTVNKKSQSITFGSLSPIAFGTNNMTLSATSTSGLPILYTSSDETKATISGNTITLRGAGDVIITARQTGNSNYQPATDIPQTLTITKGEQIISFDLSGLKKFKDQFTISASSSSNLAVSFRSTNEGIATISGNEVRIVGVGSFSIIASQTGNNNYFAAQEVSRTLLVNKAESIITFDAINRKQIGDDSFVPVVSSNSDQPITFTSSNNKVAIVNSENKIEIIGLGSSIITANQIGSEYYNPAASVSQTLAVNKRLRIIDFPAITQKVFGDESFNLNATATAPVFYSINDEDVARLNGNVVTIIGAGSAIITASLPEDATFEAAEMVQNLVINKADQLISFNPLPARKNNDDSFNLEGSSSSKLPITYLSSDEDVAMIEGTKLIITGPGSTTITAQQSGNSNYNAAISVTQHLTVNKSSQIISFDALASRTLGEVPFALSATSTSGLKIEYTTTTDKITIQDNAVTLIKPGRATIKANQSGSSNYNTATEVTQSFCINPPKPTITSANLNSTEITLTSNVSTGNQWYLNNELITGATSASFKTTQSGTYSVKSTVDDCAGESSDLFSLIITGIEKQNRLISFYPNPVSDELKLDLTLVSGEVKISIYDMIGRRKELITISGNQVFSINTSQYNSGNYLLHISHTGGALQKQFVKK